MAYTFKHLSQKMIDEPLYGPTDHIFREHFEFWTHSKEGIKVSGILSTCIHCGLRRNIKRIPPKGPCPKRVNFEIVAPAPDGANENVNYMYLMGA